MLCVWVTAYENACSWIVLARDFSVRARVCMCMIVLEFPESDVIRLFSALLSWKMLCACKGIVYCIYVCWR